MRSFKSIIFLSFLVMFTSCAVAYDIISDTDSEVDFSKYATYAIIHDDHGFKIGTDTIHKQHIDKAIEAEIEDLSYEYSENPDLQISWFIKRDTKLEQGVYNAYYSKWRSPMEIDVYEVQVGSLIVDIVDTSTSKVIWHVKVSSKIEDEIPNIEDQISKVVKDIFNEYRKDTGIK